LSLPKILFLLSVLISSNPNSTLRISRRASKTLNHIVDQIDRRLVHVLLDPCLDLIHDRLRPPYKFAYNVHIYANRFTMISE